MDLRRPVRTPHPALAGFCLALIAALTASPLIPTADAAPNYNGKGGKKPEGPPPVIVMRVTGADRGRYYGHDVLIVTGRDALDGSAVEVAIHNTDDKSGKYDPREDQANIIKTFKPGDYAKIEAEFKDNQVW